MMGFSLRNKFEEALAQVNPFDGGKTAATVRASRPAPPARTVATPKITGVPFKLDTRSTARKVWDQVNPYDNGKTFKQANPTDSRSLLSQYGRSQKTGVLGVGRSAWGTVEGIGGLYDTITPGQGQNRVTKFARNTINPGIDKIVKKEGLSNIGYTTGQVAGEVGQMLLTTGATNAVAKGASKLPVVGKAVTASPRVFKGTNLLSKTGNFVARPSTVANVVQDTAIGSGQRSARGEDISGRTIAQDAATSLLFQGGVNVAGKGVQKVASSVPKVASTLTQPIAPIRKNNELIQQYQRAFDVETNPTRRRQISQAIAELNRQNNQMRQGGYIKNPLAKDPLEALKAEARKYKSAEEFADSLNAMKYGKVTGVGQLPVSKINKAQIKALTERGLPHTDTNLKVSDFKPGRQVTQPLEVYSKGGSWVVENGNHRLAQALANGDETVPVVFKGGEGKKYSTPITDLYNQATSPQVGKTPISPEQNPMKTPTQEPQLMPQSRQGSYSSTSSSVRPNKTEVRSEVLPEVGVTVKSSKDVIPEQSGNGKLTSVNQNRMNVSDQNKQLITDASSEYVAKLSNKEVMDIAKRSGISTTTHTPEQVKQKIAEQLNVRQTVVSLTNELDQLRASGASKDQIAQKLAEISAFSRTARQQGTELGQQLQARRILANELDTPMQRIFKLMDSQGVNEDAYVKRFADVNFNDPKQVVDAYRDLVPAKASEWLDVVRYNSMLSSPLTHIVNASSNIGNVGLIAPIEKTLRGTFDAVGGLFGRERTSYAGEGGAYVKGMITATKDAVGRFAKVMKGEADMTNLDMKNIPVSNGKVYSTLSFPMRLLEASDQFFTTLAKNGELESLNYRQSKGTTVRNALAEAEDNAAYRVFREEGGNSDRGTVLNAIDSLTSTIQGLRTHKNPIIQNVSKWTLPFVKTPMNVFKQGVEYSPFGYSTMIGSNDKLTQFTRATMGTAVFGLSGLMLGTGDMTWAEPRNADEKAEWKAQGKQPYSIRIGGHWFSMSKMPPAISFPFALSAAINDAMKDNPDEDTMGKILTGVAQYGQFLSDQSYVKSIGDWLSVIQGGDADKFAQALANYPQQVVPFRALTGWVARMFDPNERRLDPDGTFVSKQVESLMQQYPGLRNQTTTRDYAGEPIPSNNPVLNSFSPIKVTDDRTNGQDMTVNQKSSIDYKEDKKATEQKFKKEFTPQEYELYSKSKEELEFMLDRGDVSQQDIDNVNKKALQIKKQLGMDAGGIGQTVPKDIDGTDNKVKDFYSDRSYVHDMDYETWQTSEPDTDSGKDLIRRVNQLKPEGFPDLPQNNKTAEMYAEFVKKRTMEKWTPTIENNQKKKLLRDIYGTQVSDEDKTLLSQSDATIRTSLVNGEIDQDTMNRLVEYDNLFARLGGSPQIGKTLRREYGYGLAPSTGSSRTPAFKSSYEGTIDSIENRARLRDILNKYV